MRSYLLYSILIWNSFYSVAQTFNNHDAEGRRHGQWQKKYEDNKQLRYEGTFEHGKEVGTFKFYKPNGGQKPTAIKIFSKTSDSVQVSYYTTTGLIISEGTLYHKERVGTWKYYHKNSSKVMMIEVYEKGKLTGEQQVYFENGQLTKTTSYVNGKRNGKQLVYSQKGVIMKEFTYLNGVLHGPTTYYDSKGSVRIEGNYKKDRKDGLWKYYKDGKLSEQKIFPLKSKDL